MAKMTATQAKAKLTAEGVSAAQVADLEAQGVDIVALWEWFQTYKGQLFSVQALMALLAILSGGGANPPQGKKKP